MKIILLIMVVMLVVVGVAAGLSLVPGSPVYQWWDSEPAPRPTIQAYTGVTPEPEDLPDLEILRAWFKKEFIVGGTNTMYVEVINRGEASSPQCTVAWRCGGQFNQAVTSPLASIAPQKTRTAETVVYDDHGEWPVGSYDSYFSVGCDSDIESNIDNNTYYYRVTVRP